MYQCQLHISKFCYYPIYAATFKNQISSVLFSKDCSEVENFLTNICLCHINSPPDILVHNLVLYKII